jgi:hypothetical protein
MGRRESRQIAGGGFSGFRKEDFPADWRARTKRSTGVPLCQVSLSRRAMLVPGQLTAVFRRWMKSQCSFWEILIDSQSQAVTTAGWNEQ